MDASTKPAAETVSRIALTVNGQPRQLELDPRTSLLDALREHLHLTGTKKGCDHGQCGACTVLINGRRINSCVDASPRWIDRTRLPTPSQSRTARSWRSGARKR